MSKTYAVNATTFAVSEYDAPDLIAGSEHDGQVVFVTADALQTLVEDTGVFGAITTGELDLGGDVSKSMNFAFLDLVADGKMHLTMTAHQDGGQRMAAYLIPTRDGANSRNRRVKMGNGRTGNAWTFTLSPPDDEVCNWRLSSLKVEPGQVRVRRR